MGFLSNTRVLDGTFYEARRWSLAYRTRCLSHSRLNILCSSTRFCVVVASHRPCIDGNDGSLPETRCVHYFPWSHCFPGLLNISLTITYLNYYSSCCYYNIQHGELPATSVRLAVDLDGCHCWAGRSGSGSERDQATGRKPRLYRHSEQTEQRHSYDPWLPARSLFVTHRSINDDDGLPTSNLYHPCTSPRSEAKNSEGLPISGNV